MARSNRAFQVAGLALLLLSWGSIGEAQDTGAARNQSQAPIEPYLTKAVDYRLVIGSPPMTGSSVDAKDVLVVQRLQRVNAARWRNANLDANALYDRFAKAFGEPVNREASPTMIHLLDRAMQDVASTASAAKDHFGRPRPFQRYQLTRVCGSAVAPKPEKLPERGSSYPSGHSAYGWTTALILARLAPDRAEALFQRADEYAQSRLVCGVHFPSDVAAGRLVATAVVSRLDSDPAFIADLAQAKRELDASQR